MTNLKKYIPFFFAAALILLPIKSFSAPLYYPGQTIDPQCYPTDSDCAVSTTTSSSVWNLNGTSANYLAGNIGIGTSTPSSLLFVNGSTTISSLTSGFVKSDNSGNLYTDSTAYTTEGENDNLSYRYNTVPLLYWTDAPKVVKTISVTHTNNYGTWDGKNLWVPGGGADNISKINENGQILFTYSLLSTQYLGNIASPLQLAYDGRNIWIASYDNYGQLIRFDTVTNTITGHYIMNPSGSGGGGIQGIVWDGTNIWIGLAQDNGGTGLVEKIDPNTGAVLASVGGQTNVNGMAITDLPSASGNGMTEYIWAACDGFITKINASDMTYQSFPSGVYTYRIATDGQYIYGASFEDGAIRKFSAEDGSLVATWPANRLLNTIAFDGKYIWTADNNYNVTIFDRDTGNVIYTLPNAGSSDLIFDGTYMWSISYMIGQVNKISVGNEIGNLKVAQSLSIMDDNSNTALFLSGTSTEK